MSVDSENLRNEIKKRREGLSEPYRVASERALAAIFSRLPIRFEKLGLYFPLQGEISALEIWRGARAQGIETYFPRCEGESLLFYEARDESDFEKSRWGLEPRTSGKLWRPGQGDLLLVPGLVFSFEGDRLGFGRGYYDRFLSQNPRLKSLGLAYEFQICPLSWEPHAGDQKVPFVLSPNGVWGAGT